MEQQGEGMKGNRQDIFELINESLKKSKAQDIAEYKRAAEAKVEEQRRKDALLAQMHPGWRCADMGDTKPSPPPKRSLRPRRQMQASVETDTEDNSPGPVKDQHPPKSPHKTAAQNDEKHSFPAAPKPEKQDPSPSLEKREGLYAYAPPARLAREEVATSTLWQRYPEAGATQVSSHRRHRRNSIVVWSGDEVHIVEESPHRMVPRKKRTHRRTY